MLNDTIHIFVRKKVIQIEYAIFRFEASSVSSLLDRFNIDMFNDDYESCRTKLSNLIKFLNVHNYDVRIYIYENFEDSIIQGYVDDDLENGTYYVNGTFCKPLAKRKAIIWKN